MKSTEAKVIVVPSCLSRNLLTGLLASTLATVNEFYRGYDVPIPFCLSRDL
jgi:hypothetical protein